MRRHWLRYRLSERRPSPRVLAIQRVLRRRCGIPADDTADNDPAAEVADIVYSVIAALPDRQVASMDLLYAEIRKAGHQMRDRAVREAVADLAVNMRVTEKPGKRGAKGYQAVPTSARESDT